jgi:hypothetical protein
MAEFADTKLLRRTQLNPVWAYTTAAGLVLLSLLAIMAAPFITPPAPGRVTGVLFKAGTTPVAALNDVVAADPNAALVDLRLGGRLIFLTYQRADFPVRISKLGALRSFDAVAAGCHVTGNPSPLERLPP